MIYTQLSKALFLVQAKIGYDSNNPDIGVLTDITDSLHQSAGTLQDRTTIVYRPYYVAALSIATSIDYRYLAEGGNAKFNDLENVIQALLGQQQAYDTANNLIIPPGYEVENLSNSFKGETYIMSARTI